MTGAGGLDLAALLAPLDVDTFLAEHWERAPFHGPGPADRFASLLALDEVEHLFAIAPDRPGQPGALAVRTREGRLEAHPVGPAAPHGRSRAAMAEAFATGHTVVVNGLGHLHPAVSRLCADVAEQVQHPVSCNLYLTPPGAAGFLPHHDLQDTMFLQVEGSKHWSLWEPATALPLDVTPAGPAPGTDRPPDVEVTIERGDVLHVPRGWAHAGRAGDTTSLHLTLGVRPTTWLDLLVATLGAVAATDVDLRRALPLAGGARPDDGDIARTAAELLDRAAAAAGMRVTQALDGLLADRMEGARPAFEPHLTSTAGRDTITLGSVVERRPGLRPVVTVTHGVSRITFPGSHVEGPAAAAPAMRLVASARRLVVGDLPGLPDEARLALVRELVLQGLLRPVPG